MDRGGRQRGPLPWGTVGIHAVPAIASHPDLELAGVWVHSDAKAGRDAGEVCGTDPVGVTTTQDRDELLALGADCICYMAHSDMRPGEVVDDLASMLAAGHNVVNTSFVPLLHPRTAGFHDQLTAACQEGGDRVSAAWAEGAEQALRTPLRELVDEAAPSGGPARAMADLAEWQLGRGLKSRGLLDSL